MQRIAHRPLQPAAVHPMVCLGVSDQRLDRLAPFQQALVLIAQRLVLAPVDDLNARVVGVHPPVAQVDDDLLGRTPLVLQQVGGLLQLRAQHVPVVRVTREAAGTDHQSLLVRDHQADLDAELVGVACLALGDAFHLRGVQRVELVLGIASLCVDAPGPLEPHRQVADRLLAGCLVRRGAAGGHCGRVGIALALHLAHHHAQDRALAIDRLAQALELLGMGVATGLAAQRLALLGIGLLQTDTAALGRTDHLVACDLQQPAVHRVGDGLGLHGRVHDHPLQLGRAHRLGLHRAVDGGLEQLLQPVLAQQASEAPDLRGVAGQSRLVVLHAAEELPLHVLGPAFDEFLVAQVEAVLQVKQAGHQAHRQSRAPGVADAATELQVMCAQQILSERPLSWPRLVRQLGRQRCLDRRPRQPGGQHRQRVAQVDHLLETGAEEIVCGHRLRSSIPQKIHPIGLKSAGSDHRKSPESRCKTTGYAISPGRRSTANCEVTRAARTLVSHRPSDARAQELTSCLSSAARSATDEHVVGLGVCCTATMFWCLLRVTCSMRRCGANRRQRCSRNVI